MLTRPLETEYRQSLPSIPGQPGRPPHTGTQNVRTQLSSEIFAHAEFLSRDFHPTTNTEYGRPGPTAGMLECIKIRSNSQLVTQIFYKLWNMQIVLTLPSSVQSSRPCLRACESDEEFGF